jgi:methyl-accepting chemotaxis protein
LASAVLSRVGFQVVIGVGGLVALLVVSVVVAVFLITRLDGEQAQLYDRNVPYASAIAAAALNAKGVANDERGFLLSKDTAFIEELGGRATKARVAFASAMIAADADAQREAVTESREGFERWMQAVRTELKSFARGHHQGRLMDTMATTRALRKTYEESLARANALAVNALRSGETSVEASSSQSVTVLLACLIAALIIGIGVAVWLVRTILRRVQKLLEVLGGDRSVG